MLPNVVGSTIALADSTGTVQTSYTYEPFGNTTSSGNTSTNSYQYTGRENDGTGLDYYRARYYSPRLQRFISEDPIGFTSGDVDFYAYVSNNPLQYTDSTGQIIDTILDIGFIIYDVRQLSIGGRKNVIRNLTALGLDLIGAATPGLTGLGLAVRSEKRIFDVEQDALIQLSKEAQRKGVSPDDANTLLKWAEELGVKPAQNHIGTEHWVGGDHIRIGPVNHIPVK